MGRYKPESIDESTKSTTSESVKGYDFLSPVAPPASTPEPPAAEVPAPPRSEPVAKLGRPPRPKQEDSHLPPETKLTAFVAIDTKIGVEHLHSELRKSEKQIVDRALKYVLKQYKDGKIDRSIFD